MPLLTGGMNTLNRIFARADAHTSGRTMRKKFIYSIRHLYGLEGARVKYGSPNCQTIFNADPGPRYEGGCPFKILDIEQLRDVFNSCLIDDDIQEELIRLKVRDAGAACGLFLKATNDDKSQVIIQSPLEYYVHVTKTDC
uniref:Pri2_2 protein n=1 Tax=Fopius arisanus TaxID=64838 RepID=A0A0C9R9N3_9HYME